MKISARLLLGFMAVIFVVIVFSIIVFLSVRELTSYIGRLNDLARHQAMAGDLRFNVAWLAMPANDYIITGKRDEYLKDFKKQSAIVEEKLRDIEAAELSAEEKEIVREIKIGYEEIKRLTQAIFNIASPIGNQRAMRLMEEMDYRYAHPASEKATRLFDIIKEKRINVGIAAKKAERSVTIVFTAGILIAFVISSVIAGSISRSISRPLGEMAALSQKIAQGDLDVAIETKRSDEIGILSTAFNNMAVNLKSSQMEQRRLFEEEQKKVQEMAVLQEVIADMASDLALEPLLERLTHHASSLVKAELAALVTLNPEAGGIQYFKSNVPLEEFPVKRFPDGKGLLGVVLKDGVPLHLENASSDPRFEGLPAGHPFIGPLLGIPLLLRGKVIGGLFVANKKGGGSFSEKDMDLVMMLSLQSATAIENARLYTKTVELANTDELTGLSNRRVFMDELNREVSRARRYNLAFSLLMIDIDHFKWINDSHGHPAGDAVLKSLAKILKGQVRQVDIAARYGGEEFAIILPETSIDGARIVGERIRSAVANSPFSINNEKKVGVTVSIGIACFPQCAQSIELLIERADQALYTAKKEGRNRVFLYRETLIAVLEYNPMEIAALLNNDINNIQSILSAIEIKAPFFRDHTEKVERYASLLAQALNLDDTQKETLRLSSLLHDIGVVTIKSAILEKPDAFTEEEWKIMRGHPSAGAKIIEGVAALRRLAPVIRSHHEWYDGTGYPDKLKGDEIPYLSRIIAIADGYGAMTCEMPWYKTVSMEKAKGAIKAGAGSQFDPEIADAFCRII